MKNQQVKNHPLVSVIMAEYNTDEKLLRESIESILKQNYENFEFIIIDDCGSNNLKKIVSDYNDKRIRVFKNKQNMGLVFSLNHALSKSKGKYIARMDTDDFSYPNRLKHQVEFLEKNPEYDLIGGEVDYYNGEVIWGESSFWGNISRDDFIKGSPLSHPTVMFKKEVMEKIGGYLNYKRCEDYATWIEMFANGAKMYVMNKKLLRYHLSISDYKKRTLKTRKGFFHLINTQYKKLNPSKFEVLNIKLKTFIAGIMPYKIMYTYHKLKNKKRKNYK